MNLFHEALLILPSWHILSEKQLSELLVSVGDGASNVTVAIVSIDEDKIPYVYEHSRISKHIVDKNEIMELLVTHQVTRLPYSISATSATAISDKDNNTPSLIIDKKNNALNTWRFSSDCDRQYHVMPPVETILKSTELFAKAVEAYDNFNFSESAMNFYSAICLDTGYKSALFNFAGLLHMVGYPILSIYYIEQVLLLDNEDMISHSFLWALTQLRETTNVGKYVHAYMNFKLLQIFLILVF